MDVDPSNQDQARHWDGDDGAFWAAHAANFDRALAGYHEALLEAASLSASDAVLDVGCGCGRTACDAARVAASVLGVDLSAAMLDVARRRAAEEGLGNVRFLQADAQAHRFEPGAFDAVLSRYGALFFGDQVAAFTNLARALRPGGRLALLAWQDVRHNEWVSALRAAVAAGRDLPSPRPDGPGPFALSDPARVRDILTRAGFGDIVLTARLATLNYGETVDAAFPFLSGTLAWAFTDLDEAQRREARESLRATLEAHRTANGVEFASAAWVITARR